MESESGSQIKLQKNGSQYFRIAVTVGKYSEGKTIRKEFYRKFKKEAEAKRDEFMQGVQHDCNLILKEMRLGVLMHLWLFEVLHVSSNIKPSSID